MRRRSLLARLLLALLLLLLLGGAGLWLATPDAAPLVSQNPERTRYMLLRAREFGLPEDSFRPQWMQLETLSPLLVCAVVKAEDRGFFRHHGVDWKITRRVAQEWLRGSTKRGGSTISQQLARNLYLSPERTASRKLREFLIAYELERTLEKRRILELYLNTVEWAEGIWGIGNASQHYFNKAPSELDAFEATFLASLLAAPRRTLQGLNAERARTVQSRVLLQLYEAALLDEDEYQRGQARMSALHKLLAGGQGLGEALATVRPTAPEARTVSSSQDVMNEVLRKGCSLVPLRIIR